MAQGVDSREDTFRPIFLVGFIRSGTTLLATLLGRHSQLAATPETHFVDQIVPKRERKRTSRLLDHHAIFDRALSVPRFWDLDLDSEKLRTRFRECSPTYASLFRLALIDYAAAQGKARVVEKTPAHLPHIPLLLSWYPGATVIYIIRDGRDAVLSAMDSQWTHDNLRRHCLMWRWCVHQGRAYQATNPYRAYTLKYEDLVESPKDTLEKLATFIGVPYEESQLDSAVPSGGVVPRWETEWKVKATAGLDATRIGVWKKHAGPEQVWTMNSAMSATLRSLGYGDVEMGDCPPLKRVLHGFENGILGAAYHPSLKPYLAVVKRLLTGLGVPARRMNIPRVTAEELRTQYLCDHKPSKNESDR